MRVINISIDLSDASRSLVHAKVQLPVKAAAIARFATPLWVPESHRNNGPVGGIVGLHFHFDENGSRTGLAWKRDVRSPHEYVVDIPPNVDQIHAEFDAVVTNNVTRRMFHFGWELALLYPIGEINGTEKRNVDKIPIRASVTIPTGWRAATALENLGEPEIVFDPDDKPTYHYLPTTVRRLMDSPILAGLHTRQYPLSSSQEYGTEEVLFVAADHTTQTHISEEFRTKLSAMTIQAQRLFGRGPPPYAIVSQHSSINQASEQRPEPVQKFYFLVALSKYLGIGGGSEHLASTQITLNPTVICREPVPTHIIETLCVFSHEYLHSWNGKRTTPAGHNPPDFTTPLDGRLLWVYEGLADYYGSVLAVRAGMITKEDWLRNLTLHVTQLGNMEYGMHWRSLEDFGAGNSVIAGRFARWDAWRGDNSWYYWAGGLVWFGVDAILRRHTGGKPSLDDFMASFFGVSEAEAGSRHGDGEMKTGKGKWATVEYTLDDIISSLTELCPDHDWKEHFQKKVADVMTELDLTGVEGAGYELKWIKGTPVELPPPVVDYETSTTMKWAIWNSIGIAVNALNSSGVIEDIRRGGPADVPGLGPRQTIVGIGEPEKKHEKGRFDLFELAEEIMACSEAEKAIRLTMEHEGEEWVVEIAYYEGLQYPLIEKKNGQSDLLDEILRPLEDCQGT
ncbi:peptidase m61 domain containing protein [Naviculisporaceae sp. PSN 640]